MPPTTLATPTPLVECLPLELVKDIFEKNLSMADLRRAAQVNLSFYRTAAPMPRLYLTESHKFTLSFDLCMTFTGIVHVDNRHTFRFSNGITDMAVLPDGSMLLSFTSAIPLGHETEYPFSEVVYLNSYREHTTVWHCFPFPFTAVRLTDDFIVGFDVDVMIAPIHNPTNLAQVNLSDALLSEALCASSTHAYVIAAAPYATRKYMVRIDLVTHEQLVLYEFSAKNRSGAFERPLEAHVDGMTFCDGRICLLWEAMEQRVEFFMLDASPCMSGTGRDSIFGEIRCPRIVFCDEPLLPPIESYIALEQRCHQAQHYSLFSVGGQLGAMFNFAEGERGESIRTHLYLYSMVDDDNVQLRLEDHIEFTSSAYPYLSVHKNRIHILRAEGMMVLDWCERTILRA